MSYGFRATGSRDVFVGRYDEQKLFEEVLAGQFPKWIIHIPGPGGMGKTRLLEYVRDRALDDPRVLVTHNMIDFYDATNRTPHSMLHNIAQQLGSAHFCHFEEERAYLITEVREPPVEAVEAVFRAFFADYRALLEDDENYRVILLFDTCEEMHTAEDWVLSVFLPRIAALERALWEQRSDFDPEEPIPHRTTAVFVGRKEELAFPAEMASRSVERLTLGPIDKDDVRDFFIRGGFAPELLDDPTIEQIYKLSGGRPLYVSLIFDWLKNGIGTMRELFATDAPFGEKLVIWVRRLRNQQTQAILCAALAWRRVEPSLLARLLAISDREAGDMVASLRAYSFAKYRPSHGEFQESFQLQDEFRDLVLRHVWPQEGREMQQALYDEIIAWYQDRIGDPALFTGEKTPQTDEEGALLAEWLYYQCKRDLNQGVALSEPLFRNAIHRLNLGFCELVMQELRRDEFAGLYSDTQRDLLDFRVALLAARRERLDIAQQTWQSLVDRLGVDAKIKATSQMELVVLYSKDNPDRAIALARETEQLYLDLIAQAEGDPAYQALLEMELGQLYNNWGFAHRSSGDWDDALTYYEMALTKTPRDKNRAITLNNMGYVYFRKSDLMRARSMVRRSLQIREALGIPNELGLGYNTMGMILDYSGRIDEAKDLYLKALTQFTRARSERGQALVYLNLGRLSRTFREYEQSIDHLEKARQVFERENNAMRLIEALNELGCTYRERNTPESLEIAEDLLINSLELSQAMTDEFSQADNHEDLSILYYYRALHAREQGDTASGQAYLEHALESAQTADNLAMQYGYTYLRAKAAMTFGRLAYDRGEHAHAFDHYFDACQLIVRAQLEAGRPAVLLQRRYESSVDDLHDLLVHLLDSATRQAHAQRLLDRLYALPEDEQAQLEMLEAVLVESIEAAY